MRFTQSLTCWIRCLLILILSACSSQPRHVASAATSAPKITKPVMCVGKEGPFEDALGRPIGHYLTHFNFGPEKTDAHIYVFETDEPHSKVMCLFNPNCSAYRDKVAKRYEDEDCVDHTKCCTIDNASPLGIEMSVYDRHPR